MTEENPWAGQGSVLLDIGGDVGALVVVMPASMTGAEVEARRVAEPAHQPLRHPHVAVVDRAVGEEVIPSLVFPSLLAGRYDLVRKGSTSPEATAVVVGGEVTSMQWPGVTPAGDA